MFEWMYKYIYATYTHLISDGGLTIESMRQVVTRWGELREFYRPKTSTWYTLHHECEQSGSQILVHVLMQNWFPMFINI